MENILLRASETVNCLNKIPNIEHRDYYDTPADRIDYQAFFENWQEIEHEEYKREFNKVNKGDFIVFINGKFVA